jgi:hypothetical protein
MNFIVEALHSLRPGSQWSFNGSTYESLVWLDSSPEEGGQEIPTKEEVEAEVARLQKEWEDTEYQRLRAKEYPDFKEYLDGVVKGNQEQIQAYIDACIAVKEKYPKPE